MRQRHIGHYSQGGIIMSVRPVRPVATEDRLGKVSADMARATLVFSTDTSAYASGDLIADLQEITGVFRNPNSFIEIISATIIDQADQANVMYLVFMSASTSLGTENSAPNISDANVLLGFPKQLPIAAADYVDYGGAKVAQLRNCGLVLKGNGSDTSLYAGLINETGTPTYAAGSLKLEIEYRKH